MPSHRTSRRFNRRPAPFVFGLIALAVIALTVGGCSSSRQLVGPTWQLVGAAEKVPPWQTAIPTADQARYTITFANDGTASITADCNTVAATYTTAGTQLDITLGAATLVACPEGSVADQFLGALQLASSFSVHGNGLTMYLGNEGSIEFAAAS